MKRLDIEILSMVVVIVICLTVCGLVGATVFQVDPTRDGTATDPYWQPRSSVTTRDITWSFDREYPTGQFVNGDWWVLGPVTLVEIDPAVIDDGAQIRNGSMINPDPEDERWQGYDSLMYQFGGLYGNDWDRYDPALNIAANLPREIEPGSSIVSTITHPGAQKHQIESAEVLTVIDQIPQEGVFRPPYSGSWKPLDLTAADLSPSWFPSLDPVESTPHAGLVVAMLERPWLDHVPTFHARFHHPTSNMSNYGQFIASDIGVAACMLLLNLPAEDKQAIAIHLAQIGIDNYGIVLDGGCENWIANGGHGSGRKFPILFAGMMLQHWGMLGIGSHSAFFGEDDQTFYVEETSPGVINFGFGGYTAADVGLADWGYWHRISPERDNSDWLGDPYRLCCTANAWYGPALFMILTQSSSLWGHPAFFDYMDRYAEIVPTLGVEQWKVSWDEFYGDMWEVYR